jgi:23S rRNA (uracil1939-C5)-methyltransferase
LATIIRDLLIESLAYGGSGLGRHEGKVIFVPFTKPGDHVRYRVIKEKKRYCEAVVEEVLVPAPNRRQPPCPVFGICGGCQWQHLPYADQTEWKENIFRSILEKQAGIDPGLIRPLATAPREWNYRSRAQLKIRLTERGLMMGFYRRGSHFVANTNSCPILHPRLNEAWALFRDGLAEAPDPGHVPQLDLETDDDGHIRSVLHYIGNQSKDMVDFFRPLVEKADITLFLQSGRKDTLLPVHGREELTIRVDDPALRLCYGAGGFAQVNLDQNRALVDEITGLLPPENRWRVLDLFCGMGNFSLPIARRVRQVVGVENFAPSITRAKLNAAGCGLNNVEFHALPASGSATKFSAEGTFDLVMLDPPRSGAYEVIKELVDVKPPRIVYVSCDPPTLGRDLLPLVYGGYRVEWSRPFDLFPQTHHTESVTLLVR